VVDVFETGRIAPAEKVDVKSRIPGQVLRVHVEEGTAVKAGDLLLTLDPTEYQREVALARARVAQSRNNADSAATEFNRAERGLLANVVSNADRDSKFYALAGKKAAHDLDAVTLKQAEDRVGFTRIVAPMDGTIIQRNIEPGETVVPGVQSTFDSKPLLTIAKLSTLLAKMNLNQIDASKTTLGQKATLTLDALPGKEYVGVVTKVAPASTKVPNKDQEVFPVEVRIDAPDGSIKPGMSADVRIHVERKPDTVSLPLEAVRKEGAAYVMKVVGEGKARHTEKTPVTLGVRTDSRVEIKSGVEAGDSVFVDPAGLGKNETKL